MQKVINQANIGKLEVQNTKKITRNLEKGIWIITHYEELLEIYPFGPQFPVPDEILGRSEGIIDFFWKAYEKNQDEAISKARDMAIDTKEGATVGLFTRDATAICGWKVL